MKKTLSILLAALMIACAFASCGAKKMDYMKEDLSKYVTLGEYKGLESASAKIELTDEDLESEIIYEMLMNPLTVEVTDRPAQENDTVSIDYVGTYDGVQFEGGTGSTDTLVLGSGAMIPGFEDGIIGMNIGETKTVDATFPEGYENNPDLAGKTAQFEITLKSISETGEITTELTDEYAQAQGFESAEEYRETVRANMEYYYDYMRQVAQSALWEEVVEAAEVIQYPSTVKTLTDSYLSYYKLYQSKEISREEATAIAENAIKQELVMYSIVKAEGLEVTDEDYQTQLEAQVASYNQQNGTSLTADTYLKATGVTRESVLKSATLMKVLDFIYDNQVFPAEEDHDHDQENELDLSQLPIEGFDDVEQIDPEETAAVTDAAQEPAA